jgi:hypothetical protein
MKKVIATEKMKTVIKGLLCGALLTATLAVGTGTANASLAESFNFTGATPVNLSLDSFNPALGTLTGVSLTLSGTVTPELQFYNFSGSPDTFINGSTTGTFNLSFPGDPLMVTTATGTLSTGNITTSNPTTIGTNPTSLNQTINIGWQYWSQYEGTSPVGLTAYLGTFSSGATFDSRNGQVFVGGNALANGSVTVDYTYNATPIPAAAYLFGSGFLGLIGIRKKLN